MAKAILWALPALALAACGGETGNKAKGRPEALAAGQYELTSEVTAFRSADKGTPKIDMPQGTRATRSVCVTDGARLPPELFADEGIECKHAGNPFARGGTININLMCERQGLSGGMGYSVTGTFEAESFEVQRQFSTQLSTDGDVVVGSTLRGRRTGECTAAPTGTQSNAAGGTGK